MKRVLSFLIMCTLLFSFAVTSSASASEPASALDFSKKKIPIETITFSKTELSLEKGKSYEIEYNIKPENASNQKLKWSSNNKKVATVDKHGKVKAKGYGVCVITAVARDGSETVASCIVHVPVPLDKATYIGNSNTKKFHYATCRWVRKMAEKHKVPFQRREDAIALKYVPCKVCHP